MRLLAGSILLIFVISAGPTLGDTARPPFPTRVFRAQPPPTGASESAEKREFNIGVIQVRLKHWTTTAPATTPEGLSVIEEFHSPFRRGAFTMLDSFRYRAELRTAAERTAEEGHHWRQERGYRTPSSAESDGGGRGRQNARHTVRSSPSGETRRKSVGQPLRQPDNTVDALGDTVPSSSERGDTLIEIFDALWRRLDLLNSPLGYMLIVIGFMLVALLIIAYALITVIMARRRRRRAREKYDALQLAAHDQIDDEISGNLDGRYRQNHEAYIYRLRRGDAPLPPARRYVTGSASNSRTQTPKNSLNSLRRHAVDHYATPTGPADGTESELERLYRSISPFKRYPTGGANVTPSVTSDDSVSLMRRVGATSDPQVGSGAGGGGRRRRRHGGGGGGGDRQRRHRPTASPAVRTAVRPAAAATYRTAAASAALILRWANVGGRYEMIRFPESH